MAKGSRDCPRAAAAPSLPSSFCKFLGPGHHHIVRFGMVFFKIVHGLLRAVFATLAEALEARHFSCVICDEVLQELLEVVCFCGSETLTCLHGFQHVMCVLAKVVFDEFHNFLDT